MSTEWTPDTECILGVYCDSISTLPDLRAEGAAEFDRWLNQIKADAWDEGFVAGYADGAETGMTGPSNPYQETDH